MSPISKEHLVKIVREDGRRLLVIPDDFFLEGGDIVIRQERDGVITVHPAETSAREAMWARFHPFVEWKDGTWPVTIEPDADEL